MAKSKKLNSKEIKSFIRELYYKGYTLKSIADILNTSPSTIFIRLNDNDI